MKKVLFIFFVILLLLAGGFAYLAYYYLMKKPVLHNDVWVYVSHSSSEADIYLQLEQSGMTKEELEYVKLAEKFYAWKDSNVFIRPKGRIKFSKKSRPKGGIKFSKKSIVNTGAYHLDAGLPASRIVTRFLRHQQTPVNVTFNECRKVEDLAGKIADDLMCDSVSILNAILSKEFLKECETDSANVIGFFLPDTYETYWDITPEKFVRRMFSEYKKFWNEKRLQKASALNVSPREVSIICSIAEEETQNRDERGIVSRLYWNRLQIGMPLQADPTVKFSIGDFSLKRILNKHLETISPYNTYRVVGLPPGPIRMVDKRTIDAFLDSKPHKYLYMCAKEDFSGTHNFATNLAEHNRNAQKYRNALNKLK